MQSTEKALGLLSTAKKYQVTNLNKFCVDYLSNNLDKVNASLILDKAVLHGEKNLVDKVLGYLGSLGETAIQCLHDHTLSKETMTVILSYDHWAVKEVDVFSLCDNWASEVCQKKGIDASSSSKREILGVLLYKIRFPLMSPLDFTTAVSQSGILTLEEEVSVLRYLCGSNVKPLQFLCRDRNALTITHTSPGTHISMKPGKPWRLTGLKLKAGVGHKHVKILVNGSSVTDAHITMQVNEVTYLPITYANTHTFPSTATVDIHVTDCSTCGLQPHQLIQTFNKAQEQYNMEWLHEIESSFGRDFYPLSGIVYHLKNE